ncbi:hypothetical protein QBC35DRAFT_498923 [Podospora australis]|uniref:Secreted protein n=1 Tax=Podospora australis TaxID=1536484 RepID=A0AAN6WSR1_9PEZI|nr:hypothetical protein QBC35DRAFT_498923 [Podospora australis]
MLVSVVIVVWMASWQGIRPRVSESVRGAATLHSCFSGNHLSLSVFAPRDWDRKFLEQVITVQDRFVMVHMESSSSSFSSAK